MRAVIGLTLLLLVGASQAGLTHRRYREVKETPAIAALELPKDQIPVTVIEAQQPSVAILKPEQLTDAAPETEALAIEIIAPQKEILQTVVETSEIAEDIVKAVEQEQELSATNAIAEAERRKDELIVEQEAQPAILKEIKEEIKTAEELPANTPAILKTPELEIAAPQVAQVTATQPEIPKIEAAAIVADPVPQPQRPIQDIVSVAAADDSSDSSLRQATQATPTQATTQQNFVQQLIQNSPLAPLGQFFNQLTGQNQPQQQTQQTVQIAADEPAPPQPTLPGFLNPSNAITSAQQAVQNVVNSTTQAFQGLQQFATSLGNQFQSTLSNLGGQQNQLSTADSTTIRPPGPIQSLISNFVGGGTQQTAGAVAGAPVTAAPGPLQGFISFFQGGNRPNGGGAVAPTVAIAAAPAAAAQGPLELNPPASQIDDKIDQKKDPAVVLEAEPELDAAAEQAAVEIESDATNEVRNSEEVGADSFEDANPNELIIVHDDAATEEDGVAA